jgi:hypothetical protein
MVKSFGNIILNNLVRPVCCTGLFLLLSAPLKAQEFQEYLDDYKPWELFVDQVWYLPAKATKIRGVYDIRTKPMKGTNIGFKYYFRHTYAWSYFVGVGLDYLPFANFTYSLPADELSALAQTTFPDGFPNAKLGVMNEHSVLSIPVGVSFKKYLNPWFFSDLSASINTKLIQYGSWNYSFVSYNPQTGAETIIQTVDAYSSPNTILYPCANLSAGISFISKIAVLRLDIKLQKSVIPFFEGSYGFYNLAKSPDTYGAYKIQGDYWGFTFTFAPKKIKALDL